MMWTATLGLALGLLLAVRDPAADPCDDIAHFATGLTPSRFLHISPQGNDSSGDGTPDRPLASIAAAARRAAPGTAIRLAPGEYDGGASLSNLAGTAQSPIWIGGEPGAPRPIIRRGTTGLHLIRPRYIIIHDLEIADAAGNGLNADDGGVHEDSGSAHHLIFQNLFIHDIGGDGNQDGLKLSGLHDYWVLDCEFQRCGGGGSGSGIDQVGCHRGLISRSTFRDLSGNGIQCKGGSEDIDIRWCHFVDAGQRALNIGGSTGFQFFRPPLSTERPNAEARNIRVLRNIIQGSDAPIAFVGAVDCIVSGNTIIHPGKWVFRILQETRSDDRFTFEPCARNRFENNLIVFNRSVVRPSYELNIGPGTSPETFTFTSNLWYATDRPTASAPTLPVPEAASIIGVDPLLGDPDDLDFRLRPGSPAVGATRAPCPIADFTRRCEGLTCSIGAFDFDPHNRFDPVPEP